MTTDRVVTIRTRAFTGEGIRVHRVLVTARNGTVLVWDPVAQHFTTCHTMPAAAQRRARKLAASVNP